MMQQDEVETTESWGPVLVRWSKWDNGATLKQGRDVLALDSTGQLKELVSLLNRVIKEQQDGT